MNHSMKVRHSLEYIEKNLKQEITLDELAKKDFMSKYHYHRLFHKIVGESVKKYIVRKRIEKAANELIETSMPIIDIALQYQYSSQEAFSRAFQKIYLVTPGKYRKLYAIGKKVNVLQNKIYFEQVYNMAA